MKNIADIAKAEPPPGMYHAANNGSALTESEARDAYVKFYRGHIPVGEFVVLRHPKIRGYWAVFVPEKYQDICETAEAQLENMLDMMRIEYRRGNEV